MNQAAHGIQIKRLPTGSAPMRRNGLASAALFAVGFCAVCSMARCDVPLVALMVGCAVAAVSASLSDRMRAWCIGSVMAAVLLIIAANAALFAGGARLACMQLFTASEAVNRYQYVALSVPVDPVQAAQAWRIWLIAAAGCGACLCAVGVRVKPVLLAVALGFACVQVYFGIVPDWWWQVGFFALCGTVLLNGTSGIRHAAPVAAIALCVTIGVALLSPGVDTLLEAASERWRDSLDAWLQNMASSDMAASDHANQTRLENRLNEMDAGLPGDDTADVQAYEKIIRYQEEISAPHVLNLRRIVLWFAVLAAVLTGPFVPFYLWDKRKKQAQAQRALMDSEDAAAAVHAIFRQIDRCARASCSVADNAAMHELPGLLCGHWPDALRSMLSDALPLWYKAAYSDHDVTQAERDQASQLLQAVEAHLLATADTHQRLRLRMNGLLPDEVDA